MMVLVTKEAATYKKLLLQKSRNGDRIEKLRGQLETLAAGKCPAGMKKHSLPFESDHWEGTIGPDLARQIGAGFDGGMSYADAREKAVYCSMAVCVKIDLQIELKRMEELTASTSQNAFINAVCSAVEEKLGAPK